MKKIPLKDWAAARYSPPPSARTLLKWVHEGDLHPPAVKVGRTYYIAANARRMTEVLAGDTSIVEQLEARA